MENKINLVELLRDCPTGMELDSTVFDNITFDYVNTQQNRVYCKVGKSESVWFTPKGGVNLLPNAKCVIFPKGKTTWEGFQRPFKDGDVVAIDSNKDSQIFIFKEYIKEDYAECYMMLADDGSIDIECGDYYVERFATEEEKEKLFKAIKDNGYKWNPETKTLEELPKFKVGDRITDKNKFIYRITEITDKGYKLHDLKTTFITFEEANLYFVKVVDIFDINTLVPFESRVLVRDRNNDEWRGQFFSHYNNCSDKPYICIGIEGLCEYKQCIPFKSNEYLLGKVDDCNEYYKTWEK